MSKKAIGAGYEINFSPVVRDLVDSIVPGIWYEEFPKNQTFQSMLDIKYNSSTDIQQWYDARRGRKYNMYLKSMYVWKNGAIILSEVQCDSDTFYIVLYDNTDVVFRQIVPYFKSINFKHKDLEMIDLTSCGDIVSTCSTFITKVPLSYFEKYYNK